MPFREEVLVPFPSTLSDEPAATHCRGTLLTASRQTLKRHGHFERYRAQLAPEHELMITSSVAATWLPIELGTAHYRACDALDLPVDEQLTLGAAVVHELQRTFIGSVLRAAARGAGINPLLGLQKFFTVYARSFKGGGGRMVRIGPKDVRVEFVGNPFAAIRYFRVAYRGFIQAGCEVFAQRVVAAELGAHLSPTTVAFRVAWV
jgi:hypothetical protein